MKGSITTAMRRVVPDCPTLRIPCRTRIWRLSTASLLLWLGAIATAEAKLVATMSMTVSPATTNVFNQPLTFFVQIAAPSLADPVPTGAYEIQLRPASNPALFISIVCEDSAFDSNLSVQTCGRFSPGLDVPVGVYQFHAIYHGDTNYGAQDIPYNVDYTITKATVHLTVDPVQPVFVGQDPFYVVKTTGGYQPTGLIEIDFNTTGGNTNVVCDTQVVPNVGDNNSTAICLGGFETAGSYPVTAYYAGDANHFATQVSDNVQTLTVYPTPVVLSVIPAPASIGLGTSTTVTVTGTSPFGTPVIGAFSVTDGEVSCVFESTDTTGPDSCVLTPISAGQKTLTASYAGYPGYYDPSTGTAGLSVTAPAINGVCGSDNGRTLTAPPTNLCSAGTASVVSGSGPWTWTCSGANGGSNATCAASQTAATSFNVTPSAGANGSISPSAVQAVTSGATATFTVTRASGYSASVGGTCGGNLSGATYSTNAVTADCTVIASFALIVTPVNGVCGSDNGRTLTLPPTNLCSAGTASAINGNGPWNWTCAGSNNGTTANCSAQLQAGTGTTTPAPMLDRWALWLLMLGFAGFAVRRVSRRR
jgi:hypothetical protein